MYLIHIVETFSLKTNCHIKIEFISRTIIIIHVDGN